jgi:hypothetical protein
MHTSVGHNQLDKTENPDLQIPINDPKSPELVGIFWCAI